MSRKREKVCLWCNSIYEHIPDRGVCPKCGYNHFGEFDVELNQEESQAVIIKFGNLSTLESMRNGNVWFQSPKYYQDYKGNPAVCDISECAYDYIMEIPIETVSKQLPFKIGDTIKLDGKEVTVKGFSGARVYSYSNTQNYNRLLCFYSMKIKNGMLGIRDSKLKSFGSHFCLVDIKKLVQKVRGYALENDLFFWPCNVKYMTNAYRGVYNPTCKGDAYAYQNEFRFILQGEELNNLPEKEPKKIKIDGMNEIMKEPQPMEKFFEIQTSKELFELFDIQE